MTTRKNTNALNTATATLVAALLGNRDALVDLLAVLADRGDLEGCEMVAAALTLHG